MSNEKQGPEQEQTPAEVPAADGTPNEEAPAQPESSLELEQNEAPEASGEVEPDLDLHLRGEDAEPISRDFGEPDDPDVLEPPDELPPVDELEPPDDVQPYEPEPSTYEPPRAPLHHRLMRRPEGKVIAGVCSGLGAYTNTDPVLWRIGFVIFGLTSVGVLAYIVAWLVMPEARRGEPLPDRPPSEAAQITRWAALAAIILGCWVIFRGFFNIGGGWFWGLLLIGIGFAVWGRDFVGGRGPTRPPFDGPPFDRPPAVRPERWTAQQKSASPADRATPTQYATPAPPANPATPAARAAAWPGPRPGNTAPTRPMPPTRPPRYTAPQRAARRREPSYLGRLVVGAGALAIGLGLVLNNMGAIDLTAKGILGVLVGIVGLGLLVGAWAGRARWLILPGLGLTCALLLASWAPAFAKGGFGEIVWQPQTRKALLPKYEHGAGRAVLDLTEVSFNAQPREVEVDLNFGELLVVVPEDVPVTARAHVQGGEIHLFGGTENNGWDIRNTRTDGGDEDIGLLTIDAEVAFGEITVRREQAGDDFTPGRSNGRRSRFGLDRIGGNP